MAGEAKTNSFMLATATVMIGPTTDLFNLNPAAHSIGLVKNFHLTAEPTYTELTQGIKNTIVYSVMTQNPVRATMEAFEFTSKNIAYGLGLDGSSLAPISTGYTLKTAIVGGVGTGTTGAVFTPGSDVSADFVTGGWIYIQHPDNPDVVHVGRISANSVYATSDLTVKFAGQDVPTGVTFPVGSKISKVNRIDVGSKAEQPYLAAKIIGVMPDGNQPVTILFPKLRIIKGFTLAFQSDNFGNLPFEFTPYELVNTDPNYALFAGTGPAAVLTRQ